MSDYEYEIDTTSSNNIFGTVAEYISTNCGSKRRRINGYRYDSKKDSGSEVSLMYGLISNVPYSMNIDGSEVNITVKNVGSVVGTDSDAIVMKRMILKAKRKKPITKLIKNAIQESEKEEVEEERDYVNVYVYKETYWKMTTSQKKRSIDTIYLNRKEKEELVDDVKSFMDDQKIYEKFGISYKRSYLLEGPPGTGKSSIIYAIASHYDLNVGIFKMSTERSTLEEAYKSLPANTILLIEDIEHCLNDERRKFSINDLLNVLDGVMSKQKLLTFITTNHVDQLPKVMLRPGRIDVIVHFDYATKEQIISIFNAFCPDEDAEEFYEQVKKMKLTPAALQKFLFRQPKSKRNIRDLEKIMEKTYESDTYRTMYS